MGKGMRESFYVLVLAEIEAQPNLKKELGQNDIGVVALQFTGFALDKALEIVASSHPAVALAGAGFAALKALAPPPREFLRDVGELHAHLKSPADNYQALCRSALLHLFWGDLERAEKKINLAKAKNDAWAFAHHVYGLLRGLQEESEGARFELHLAMEREAIPEARERIGRALTVVS